MAPYKIKSLNFPKRPPKTILRDIYPSRKGSTSHKPCKRKKPNQPTMSSEQPPQGAVDLDKLSLEELNQAKQQEEGRLQALTGRYAQLRAAAARLTASSNAISEISPSSDGKEVMIPLTESVYAPGKLREPNKLLV